MKQRTHRTSQQAEHTGRILERPAGCPPGSAGVPPAQQRQGLTHLLDLARPATASGPCFGQAHAVRAGRVFGCPIAGKLSGAQRECMRAGRPRSRGAPPPQLMLLEGARAGLPGRSRRRCSRAVSLGDPSCLSVDFFFAVADKPQRLQVSPVSSRHPHQPAPPDAALTGGSGSPIISAGTTAQSDFIKRQVVCQWQGFFGRPS